MLKLCLFKVRGSCDRLPERETEIETDTDRERETDRKGEKASG